MNAIMYIKKLSGHNHCQSLETPEIHLVRGMRRARGRGKQIILKKENKGNMVPNSENTKE